MLHGCIVRLHHKKIDFTGESIKELREQINKVKESIYMPQTVLRKSCTFKREEVCDWEIFDNEIEGDCPCLVIEENSGNLIIQVLTKDVIDKQNRRVVITVKEYIKPNKKDKFTDWTSGIYENNVIILDDTKYCLEEGPGLPVPEETSHTIDSDGVKTLNPGYITLYEYHYQKIGWPYVFIEELNTLERFTKTALGETS